MSMNDNNVGLKCGELSVFIHFFQRCFSTFSFSNWSIASLISRDSQKRELHSA